MWFCLICLSHCLFTLAEYTEFGWLGWPLPSLAQSSCHTWLWGRPCKVLSPQTKKQTRNSLVVQWLRLCAPNAGGWGLIPIR